MTNPIGVPLDDREVALVATAADFTRRRIAPSAAEWGRERCHLPREVFGEWAELGLMSLQVSREAGGQGASFFCKVAIAEAMSRCCMPSCFALINAQGSATRMEREGSADQARRYLPLLGTGKLICAPAMTEPGAGSDFAAIRTLASKVPGGWRLDGAKAWVTNGVHADLAVVYAQTEPDTKAAGIASFLVDLQAEGVERGPAYRLCGGHAIGANEIRLSDVFVPDENLLAPAGDAFKRALNSVSAARIHVAAMACGIAAASLDRAVAYAHRRQSFGRALIRHQGLRWGLADVATELEAARGLVLRAAQHLVRGDDAVMAASQAKLYAAEMAVRAVTACTQAMGAVGLREDEPFSRHLTSARVACIADGTNEMQRDRIGLLLGKHYGPPGTGMAADPA